MRKTLTILVATTALGSAIGAQAASTMRAPTDPTAEGIMTVLSDGWQSLPLILASDDDDDDDDRRDGERRGHDDDDGDDDDCDDDDDDDHGCRGGRANPAPAGTVAPPQNGLFGNGTPPQVQTN